MCVSTKLLTMVPEPAVSHSKQKQEEFHGSVHHVSCCTSLLLAVKFSIQPFVHDIVPVELGVSIDACVAPLANMLVVCHVLLSHFSVLVGVEKLFLQDDLRFPRMMLKIFRHLGEKSLKSVIAIANSPIESVFCTMVCHDVAESMLILWRRWPAFFQVSQNLSFSTICHFSFKCPAWPPLASDLLVSVF